MKSGKIVNVVETVKQPQFPVIMVAREGAVVVIFQSETEGVALVHDVSAYIGIRSSWSRYTNPIWKPFVGTISFE